MTEVPPVPPALSFPPPDCEACRFGVAPTRRLDRLPLGPHMIGCAMHNIVRLRRGEGCGDHAPPPDAMMAVAQAAARAQRIRTTMEGRPDA